MHPEVTGALPQKDPGMAGAAEPPGKTYRQNEAEGRSRSPLLPGRRFFRKYQSLTSVWNMFQENAFRAGQLLSFQQERRVKSRGSVAW